MGGGRQGYGSFHPTDSWAGGKTKRIGSTEALPSMSWPGTERKQPHRGQGLHFPVWNRTSRCSLRPLCQGAQGILWRGPVDLESGMTTVRRQTWNSLFPCFMGGGK